MSQSVNNQAAKVKQLIIGANKHFPNGSQQLQVGGATFTVTGLTALFQSFVDNRAAVEASKAATKAKLQAESAQAPSQLAVIRAFETVVRSTFGSSADVLADFGLAPPKARTPLTTQQMAARAAKAKATRVARGTTSRKQKLAVKGDVTGVIVTPVTAPTQAPPTSPAPPVTTAPTPAQPGTTNPSAPTTGVHGVVASS